MEEKYLNEVLLVLKRIDARLERINNKQWDGLEVLITALLIALLIRSCQ
jgi:hypothetical protein